jgi:hypothetical protein
MNMAGGNPAVSSAGASPTVFVSYSHDSEGHKARALAFSDQLRAWGVDCHIDRFYEHSPPREGWPQWCRKQVQNSAFVLVICTETYNRRFEGEEDNVHGSGAKWEGFVITQELYDDQGKNDKFIPIVFGADDFGHIPIVLRSTNRYDVNTDKGFQNLFRHITRQPSTPISRLGALQRLPPLKRPTNPDLPQAEAQGPGGPKMVATNAAESIVSPTFAQGMALLRQAVCEHQEPFIDVSGVRKT